MSLLRLARRSELLLKEAEPAVPATSTVDIGHVKQVAHGTEGRILRPAVSGVGLKTTQGPRAYGPRLKMPGS